VGPVHIDASNNQVNVAIYNGQTLIDSISKSFDFVNQIETEHNDYGDLKNITWIVSPWQFAESFNVLFSENSAFEDGFDYVYVTYKGNTTIYTGLELASQLYESIDSTMIIQLITDDYVSDSYGFSTEITYDIQYPLELNGDASMILSLGEPYSEMGVTILPAYQALYTLQIDGVINTSVLGDQYIYYHLLDQSDHIIYTLTRIVTIVADNIAPTFDAIEDQTIELGHENIDWTTLIINAQDNLGGVLTFAEVSDLVVYNQIGKYTVTVSVTDSNGNVTVKQFDVTVSDSNNPIVTLKPSVDSIYVGDTYVDQGVNVTDSTTTTVVVQGEVDVTRPGIYQLTYIVTDAQLNETQIVRYVHVTQEEITVKFILGDTKTTIAVGETFVNGICSVKLGFDSFTCDVKQNNLDINTPGVYMITYSYTYGAEEYTYDRYVFVYGTSPLVLQYGKKEEGIVV